MKATKSKLFLDFEFRNSKDSKMEILCCSFEDSSTKQMTTIWLLDDESVREDFGRLMINYTKSHAFCAYVVQAEARCLFQIWEEFGIEYNIKDIDFIDLYLEYRMLTNHNHHLAYGRQYIKGKEVITTPPPRFHEYKRDKKADKDMHHKPEHSLASACYKMINKKIDTELKEDMRDLILFAKEYSQDDKDVIMKYCESDVTHLDDLLKSIVGELISKLRVTNVDMPQLRQAIYLRGEYAARTAKMEMLGYPINFKALKKFTKDVPHIVSKECVRVNDEHPEVHPFEWDKRKMRYTLKQDRQRNWIKRQRLDKKWDLTDTGFLSLSLDAFRRYYNSRSEGFGGAMVRYLYTKQSLNGFLPAPKGAKKKTFWDFVGDDERARPWFGIYGSQSARSQPGATGFLPLKANWMRAFIQPKPGRAIVGIDYASQEFLLSGLISGDDEMIKAYHSGDPYLYFAKLDGAVPKNATKESHKHERSIYKTVTLGISYNMGPVGLAFRLTNELNRHYSTEEAQELINAFSEAFPDFHDWKNELIDVYGSGDKEFRKIKLPCGWVMWGDNDNWRSTGNFPIQGFGSSIMRKAVALAQDRGLDVIYTLHDALYVEYDSNNTDAIDILWHCMEVAFSFYFPGKYRDKAKCRLDAYTWGPDFDNEEVLSRTTRGGKKYDYSKIYVDDKGKKDYLIYQSYFKEGSIE